MRSRFDPCPGLPSGVPRVPGLLVVAGGGGHFKLSGIPDGPRAACCRKRHHGVLQKRFEIYIMFVIVAVVSPSFRLNIVWAPLSYRCPPEPAFSLMDLSVALLLQAIKTLWLFVSASHGQYNKNEATSRRTRAHRRGSFWWDCGGFACPRVGLSDEGNQIDQVLPDYSRLQGQVAGEGQGGSTAAPSACWVSSW